MDVRARETSRWEEEGSGSEKVDSGSSDCSEESGSEEEGSGSEKADSGSSEESGSEEEGSGSEEEGSGSEEEEMDLWEAAQEGDTDRVKQLLEVGADPTFAEDGAWETTPLHEAAGNGNLEAVLALLEAHADVNVGEDKDGVIFQSTPLLEAVRYDHFKIASALLTAGADVDACAARDEEGDTPLHVAAREGNSSCVELLLQHKADTSIRNGSGQTAMDIAAGVDESPQAWNGRREQVLRLLQEVSAEKAEYDSDSSDEEFPAPPPKRQMLSHPSRQSAMGGAGPSSTGYGAGPSGGSIADRMKPHLQKKKKEDNGKIHVKVETCDDAMKENITLLEEKNPYKMDSKPRGHALIVSITKFTTLPFRKGGDVDLSNITALLEELSFKTHILEEKKAQEIEDEVRAFSQRAEHRQADCCVVVPMSHGDKGVIFGTDDKPVQLDTIFAMFDNKNCPLLKGKPKLFFTQACRGSKVDKGVPEDEADGPTPEVDLKSEIRRLLHLPEDESDGPGVQSTRTDMLFGYATQLGFKSFRNTQKGSWFIQDITKVFMEHAKDTSLVKMMDKVIKDVSKRTAQCPGNPEHGGKEKAEYGHTLAKPLYFFPGV